jgi:hypothetical protein
MIARLLSRFSRKGDEDRRNEFELALVELARDSREWSAPAGVEHEVLEALRARKSDRRPVAPVSAPPSRRVRPEKSPGIAIPSLKWLPAGLAIAATVAGLSWVVLDMSPGTDRLAPLAKVPLASDSGARAPAKAEVRSDFIVLQQAVYTRALERGGHFVETEMPRYALAAYDLPVNPDRLDEPVKAELLLADDGSVGAVRFIQ